MLSFQPPRSETRNDFRRRIWQTVDGQFRLVRSQFLLCAMPATWYALRRAGGGWQIISLHRKRGPAVRAIEQQHRKAKSRTEKWVTEK